MAKGQKGIFVTEREYALINESRELFFKFTGCKMSWGAYITALSLGALAAKSLEGFLIRCPNCQEQVEMILEKPHLVE